MTADSWTLSESSVAGLAPFRSAGVCVRHLTLAWILAAGLAGTSGAILYGPAALKVLFVAAFAAVTAESVMRWCARKPPFESIAQSGLMGLLLGLTLPATVPMYVPITGAFLAILIGRGVFGGMLHPALVGRVLVQFIFPGRLSLSGTLAMSPVLAPGHLLIGDLHKKTTVSHYQGWMSAEVPDAYDAILIERPVQALRRFAQDRIPRDGELLYTPLIRDVLPPWRDTVLGFVPGGIGETGALMLIVACLYLVYRGCLRWQLPAVVLGAAAVAAAVFPVELQDDYRWFPVLAVEQGRAVGLAYVFYHLTSGQLMLGACLLAGDFIASPMRVQGQLIYGAGIGLLTIFMRLYGVIDGECYWSILIMNALVSTIDRRTQRPVLGLAD